MVHIRIYIFLLLLQSATFINKSIYLRTDEEKFKTLEKERPDEMEMAAQENEERETDEKE